MHDKRSEQAVISTVLWRSRSYVDVFNLEPSDFYDPAYQTYFTTLKTMYENNIEIGLLSATNELQKAGHGDLSTKFSIEFTEVDPLISGLDSAIDRLREMSKRRIIQKFCLDGKQNAQDLACSVEDILLEVENDIDKINAKNNVSYGVFGDEGLDIERFNNKNSFIPTGIKALDEKIAGFFNTHLIIIAGRTGFGKTSLALSIAKYNFVRGDVLFFSLEMMKRELEMRLICMDAELEFRQILGGLKESQTKKFDAVQKALQSNARNFKIFDNYTNFKKIVNECKRQALLRKPVLIVIDYLQLLQCPEIKESRRMQLEHMTRNFKNLAAQLDVPIVLLSQLSRAAVESSEPQLHHLRESGSIEQDCNTALFVHRKKDENFILVAKNRQGQTGKVKVDFEKRFFKFEDIQQKVQETFSWYPEKKNGVEVKI